MMRWAGHAARRKMINAYKVFVGMPEGKTGRKWYDNINMYL
jgi:hypothetical protein